MAKILLVVDDHQAIREGIQLVVEAKGKGEFETVLAENGAKALELAKDKPPDVALVDLMMPEMDGGQLSTKLKEQYPQVKVIILTAKSDEITKEKVEGLGVVDKFLTKPIDNNQLYEEISALIK